MKVMEDDDGASAEVDKFLTIFEMMRDFIFGDAMFEVMYNRQVKLRKPEEPPLEEDVAKVRQHTMTNLKDIMNDSYLPWEPGKFIELRDLAVTRLTVFNARRGGWSLQGSRFQSTKMQQMVSGSVSSSCIPPLTQLSKSSFLS
ncbi:hypothetical protein HOLleu_01434 [Holothuria leucospilota]|uniref:Uncharacterized protein n=1 Tax=Holothuria leucospilota TaxID=206669 RepID=A0A9Q1CPX8_HOLLE|nr:hypothetical protein HOLleu_01434 [Holothuria leucospilota]